ncbi:unnamed protein product [Hyaloperonospora brassicae]|uniref:WW domain-containing protein n=1 Tax=Hyaloperonospora brassicae TaxID=162125 RepID=A0AAV0TP88_HYABA|nr:unnamed protein product [Hyaloperonospora brassicae]
MEFTHWTDTGRSSASARNDASFFGWQLFHDRQRNLVYYLHTYTGEVRWPRPETVGFVMHGLKPLPATALEDNDDARAQTMECSSSSFVNPDIWSPYYPHVVMLPSGLVQVHPSPDSAASEMWCGYNRFPLAAATAKASRAFPALDEEKGFREPVRMTCEPRLLPPTWEEASTGLPFLPPYPVAILEREGKEDRPHVATGSCQLEKCHTPELDISRGPPLLYKSEEDRRGTHCTERSTNTKPKTSIPMPKQLAFPKEGPAPSIEKKEHNRKGYLLRQARKMVRGSGVNGGAAGSATSSKPCKDQDSVPASRTKPNLAARGLEEEEEEEEEVQDDGGTIKGVNVQRSLHH